MQFVRSWSSAFIGLTAAGCSSALVGTWKSAVELPEHPPLLMIKQAEFRADGKYFASARVGDRNLFLQGTYSFNGADLTLRSDGRADRRFRAVIRWSSDLDLTTDGQTQRLHKQ